MSVDILISFDTTGSMASVIHEVRLRVQEFVNKIIDHIPDSRVGIIAHGDWCDKNPIDKIDFTSSKQELISFIRNNKNTGGGDDDEFYEYVLNIAQKDFSWRSGAVKIMLLIADANPHAVGYRYNGKTYFYDWRDEAKGLGKLGVNIYAVQALSRKIENNWYQQIASITNGKKVFLNQFTDAVESIISICYHSVGRLQEYKDELETTFKMNRNLANLFSDLDKGIVIKNDIFTRKDSSGLISVLPTRFQVLNVNRIVDIKSFVESLGVVFKKGRGFYEFQKRETIQENKEIILQNKMTGDMFTGSEARDFIGLPFGTRGNISPSRFDDYRVFVQSTSSNRKLIPGYKFLYENY